MLVINDILNNIVNNALEDVIENNIETMPNIKTKTMGGKVFWDNIKTLPGGYRIQRHSKDTNHYRILDKNDYRIAYGTKKVIENYINNHFHTTERMVRRGDVIAVNRFDKFDNLKLYQHFGVYVGDRQVIHFNGNEKNKNLVDMIPFIHRASIDDFLSNSKDFYVLDFEFISNESWQFKGIASDDNNTSFNGALDVFSFLDKQRVGKEISRKLAYKIFNEIKATIETQDYHLYSPEETVRRAESKIGSKHYNLLFNNCEHFAIWCKTGLHNSEQINRILKANIWEEMVI